MTDDRNNKVAQQLKRINTLLFLGVLLLAGQLVAYIYYIRLNQEAIEERRAQRWGSTFKEQTKTLTDANEWDEMLKLSLQRQKEKPTDANGYFVAGMAYFYKGELDKSEAAFNKSIEIEPDRKDGLKNWFKEIEKQRKEKAKKP